MNMLLSFLFTLPDSLRTRVLFDLVGPNGERGVRKFPFPWEIVFIAASGIIVIVLIVLAVKYLVRMRNNKAKSNR
jgi:hypothetical protein